AASSLNSALNVGLVFFISATHLREVSLSLRLFRWPNSLCHYTVGISINDKSNSEDYHFYIANLTNYLITAGIVVANIMEGQQLDAYVSKKEQLLEML
ncbi:hypothetical protein ACRTDJ_19955, partial [Shewanella algae]